MSKTWVKTSRKVLSRLLLVFGLCGLPLLILSSFLLNACWMTPFLIGGYVAEIWTEYRWHYGPRKEKLRMRAQKPARHYYYDRWYTPADSTILNYLASKLREIKKKIRRKPT